MNDLKPVADFVQSNQEKIISRWKERVKSVVPAASDHSELALLDRLPDFIENLINAILHGHKDENEIASNELGCEHGKQRAQLSGYSLKQVITEYHLLKKVIFEIVGAQGLLTPEGKNIIQEVFDVGIMEAAIQFTDFRGAEAKQDLTISKENERELQVQRDLREQFVFTLSHDLRTPLTSAKMQAQLLMRKHNDENTLQALHKIIDRLDSADEMIENLLDASRIKAGEHLPLDINECHLEEIVKRTIEDMSISNGDRFVFKATGNFNGHWSCSGLRRILENLCNNAVKYGAAQTPITISLKELPGNQISISVHNEGNPIPIDEQKTIFDPFRRSKTADFGKQKGWGLGLTLVRGIAEAHGGHTEVESSLEDGTTFSVMLPFDARPFQK